MKLFPISTLACVALLVCPGRHGVRSPGTLLGAAVVGRLEAESSQVTLLGSSETSQDSSASGGACVSVASIAGSGISHEHSAAAQEAMHVTFRAPSGAVLLVQVYAPSLIAETTISAAPTSGWTSSTAVGVRVPAGISTITITSEGGGAWTCDYMDFCAAEAICTGCDASFASLNLPDAWGPWYAPWQTMSPPTQGVSGDTALSAPTFSTVTSQYFVGAIASPGSVSPGVGGDGPQAGFTPGSSVVDAYFQYADKSTTKYDGICAESLCGSGPCSAWDGCSVHIEISGLQFLNAPDAVCAFCTVKTVNGLGGGNLRKGEPPIFVSASAYLDCGQQPAGDDGDASISYEWMEHGWIYSSIATTTLLAEKLKDCSNCHDVSGNN